MNKAHGKSRIHFTLAACWCVTGLLTLLAGKTSAEPEGAKLLVSSVKETDTAMKKPAPEDSEWTLTELNGKAVAAAGKREAQSLKFDAEKKRVTGFAGVNRFFGGYERDGDKLKFDRLASTRMGGPPEAMKSEQAFIKALGDVSQWRIVDGVLELMQKDKVVARFSGAKAEAK